VQLSNVPEARYARRLLIAGSVLFAVLFVLNVITTILSFENADSDRWLNLIRLIPNLVVPLLLWRGYVALAALAERAAIYKRAIERDLPQLRAQVERRSDLGRVEGAAVGQTPGSGLPRRGPGYGAADDDPVLPGGHLL